MKRQLERAGFTVEAVLGDYRGRPWREPNADAWLDSGPADGLGRGLW